MNTFEQIKAQIQVLPRSEYVKLLDWFSQQDAEEWDREIARDAES